MSQLKVRNHLVLLKKKTQTTNLVFEENIFATSLLRLNRLPVIFPHNRFEPGKDLYTDSILLQKKS